MYTGWGRNQINITKIILRLLSAAKKRFKTMTNTADESCKNEQYRQIYYFAPFEGRARFVC